MEIATYNYQHITGIYPFKKFDRFNMKVEILEELRGGWLRVRFLGYHADGRPPNTVTRVNGKSVKRISIIEVASRSGKSNELEIINQYLKGLDPELIRKPYKDD